MGISPSLVDALQELGHDSIHVAEVEAGRLPDPEILEKARNEGRVLLTHDLGFGELLAASGSDLPSVVTFRLRNMRPDNVKAYLGRVLAECSDALEHGAIVTVTEAAIRVRGLPLEPPVDPTPP